MEIILLYKNADWLYNEYIIERESTNSIGKKCDVSKDDIRYYLLKFNILIRSMSEAQKLAFETGRMSKEHLSRNGKITGGFHGIHTGETKQKISMTKQGVVFNEWNGFASFEPYCEKFDFRLKEEIRNRDNRVCQLCGKSEIENGRRLAVHHIDGDKKNNKETNLISLCNSCHAHTNYDRDVWKIYFENIIGGIENYACSGKGLQVGHTVQEKIVL